MIVALLSTKMVIGFRTTIPIDRHSHLMYWPSVAPLSSAISSDSVELWLTMDWKHTFQNTVFPPTLTTMPDTDLRVSTSLA